MRLITKPIVHMPTGTILASKPKEKYLEDWIHNHSQALQMFEISLHDSSYCGFCGDLPSNESLNFILDLMDMYCDIKESLNMEEID